MKILFHVESIQDKLHHFCIGLMVDELLFVQIGRGFCFKFIYSPFGATLQWLVVGPSPTNSHVLTLGSKKALTLSKIAIRIELFRNNRSLFKARKYEFSFPFWIETEMLCICLLQSICNSLTNYFNSISFRNLTETVVWICILTQSLWPLWTTVSTNHFLSIEMQWCVLCPHKD